MPSFPLTKRKEFSQFLPVKCQRQAIYEKVGGIIQIPQDSTKFTCKKQQLQMGVGDASFLRLVKNCPNHSPGKVEDNIENGDQN
jgi:hypothetical protein